MIHLHEIMGPGQDRTHDHWIVGLTTDCTTGPGNPPLSHISLASLLWDIGKQCKTSSDAAKFGV